MSDYDLYEEVSKFGAEMGCPAGVRTIDWARVEIKRLRSDLALLGPVTTPTHGIVCASCVQDVSPNWTYCPYCGAQERNSATGERIRHS